MAADGDMLIAKKLIASIAFVVEKVVHGAAVKTAKDA